MEDQPLNKRLKSDTAPNNQVESDKTTTMIDNPDNDISNSCSSNISNLLTEADNALQELKKRQVKPNTDESTLGIELFIGSTKDQFHGLIKTRYADFIVHEIDLDGNVAKLTNLEPPAEEDASNPLKLEDLFERKVLVCLSNVNSGLLDSYKIDVTGMDKDTRTSIHHAIRESYDHLESSTVSDTEKLFIKGGKQELQANTREYQTNESSEVPDNAPPTDNEETNKMSKEEMDNSSKAESPDKKEDKRFILVTRRNKSSRHRSMWPRGRHDYTRFVLYKENKDTMDAIHNIAVATNSKPSTYTYAGTKDRRAITTQFISGWRIDPKRLIGVMRRFNKRPYLKVGNFSFHKEPIRLGQLKANRFDIVIRHLVHNGKGIQVIEDAMESLKENGYINYFGLQRFGTRAVQTHEIGLAILQSNWRKGIDLILSYRFDENFKVDEAKQSQYQDNNNEPNKEAEQGTQRIQRNRGQAWARGAEQHNACIDMWKSKQDAELVFKKFPQFRITNEGLVMKALSKIHSSGPSNDLYPAISSLPRNTRSMYVHSYQSLLWNKLTTFRLKKLGYKVVVGDLVLPTETNISDSALDAMLITSVGEDSGDNEVRQDDVDKQQEKKVSETKSTENGFIDDIHSKIVTVTENDLDKYSIFDVVLPLPGSRVKIPSNEVGNELKRLFEQDGLTLESFRARERVFVAYGSYRKIIVKPENLSWSIKQYSNPRENLIDTDLDEFDRELQKKDNDINDDTQRSPTKSDFCDEALVVSLDLPPSSYATMFLRELMKKPSTDFNNNF